jgi:mannose-6-phosphate isomerase
MSGGYGSYLMKTIKLLENPVQEYAWGSRSAIPELLAQPVTQTRQAELWMGAHPKSPSYVRCDGQRKSLIELVEKHPQDILGATIARKFCNRLPFLFKVLAAARPLSIQAHPNLDQAREGFDRENSQGLPRDAFTRNYRDPNHKPEVICPLQSFWALNGFRRIDATLGFLEELRGGHLEDEIKILKERPNPTGLREFFRRLMTKPAEESRLIVRQALEAQEKRGSPGPEGHWMRVLQKHFPDDIGVLGPLLLNLVSLQPGEAMYLPAGELHAYLEGVGVELMANSDNVLRGGLTSKHIDVPELLHILSFRSRDIEILSPTRLSTGEKVYPTPAEEFELASIQLTPDSPFASQLERSVEILLCTEGSAEIRMLPSGDRLELYQGESVLVPAALHQYRLEGQATIFKAQVPL